MPTRRNTRTACKQDLTDLPPAIEKHKAELAEDAKRMVLQEFQTVFNAHPELDGIRWKQMNPFTEIEDDPVMTSEFRIDGVEYRLNTVRSARCLPYGDPDLTDSGFDKQDTGWTSPWNDRRIDNPALLDTLTNLEERLFDAEASLALAFGDQAKVTVTRSDVVVETEQ